MYTNMTRPQLEEIAKANGLYLPKNLLSVGNDAKTAKGEKFNYMTGILYMTPDYEICPASKIAACDVGCLVSAGRGKFNSVKAGRDNKTALYKKLPELFYEALERDITRLEKKAKKLGLDFCVRLNGTSDIDHTSFIASMPDVQFYDYTKMSTRRTLPNYHLTFSYSGASASYEKHVRKAISNGLNVAVVFRDNNLPNTFLNLPVINGDDSDLRFLDYKVDARQCVVGLYAKGDAKKDSSGFVVDAPNLIAMVA